MKEHESCLQRFVKLFGKGQILGILGDREFANGHLFCWLNTNNIPFYIRIKEDSIVRIKNKKICNAEKIFCKLNPKEQQILEMSVEVFGQKVYLAGSRSERGELMIVATNQLPANAIAIYLRRWEIECLFHALKGRGFRFEETHLTKLERIEKLMVLLTIGFCWAHKVGEWRATKKPIVLNKHGKSQRPQNSYFRYGLDLIREALFSFQERAIQFTEYLIKIRLTPSLGGGI